jgi:hypothetical protein
MTADWQTLLALAIVAAATGFLVRRVVGLFRAPDSTAACGSCGACDAGQTDKPGRDAGFVPLSTLRRPVERDQP